MLVSSQIALQEEGVFSCTCCTRDLTFKAFSESLWRS